MARKKKPQLTKEMYYPLGRKTPASRLFGLWCAQMRHRRIRVAKNAGWYNRRGEKLGWGDLSRDDLRRIETEIARDELFIVLPERESFWAFVTKSPGPTGNEATTSPKERVPGIQYVLEHASMIIAEGRFFLVSDFEDRKRIQFQTIRFRVITRQVARELVSGW